MSQLLSAATPSRVGDFAVVGVLGEGGSGIVYDARWGHREIALKVLHPLLVATAKEHEQFLLEARRLAEIHHAGVVKVLAVGEAPDGRPFLAMEKLRGETLAARLARGPMPVAQALELFGQLCDAVEAFHGRGLVHRDLKPENVMLVAGADGRDHAVLLDFGIAKDLASPASTTTQDGGVRGTPAYMAPERFFGQPASVATDVYELAVTLFAMLAGRLPWDDCADPEVRLDPRRLADVAPHVPPALDVEVRRALSTRAQNRPASAADLRAAVMGAAGMDWAPRRTVDLGSGPVQLPPPVIGESPALAATVPARRAPQSIPPPLTPTTGPGTAPPPTTVRTGRPLPRGAWLGLGLGAVAAVSIGVTVHLTSRPGEKLDEVEAARAAAAATEELAARAATPPTPVTAAAEDVPAAAPIPAVPVDVGIRALPDDSLFAMGVRVDELATDNELRDVIDLFAQTEPGIAMRAEARLDSCPLDLRGLADWVVVAGPGEETAIDIVASGRWTRADVEACLKVSVEADTAAPADADARVTVLRGPRGERTVAWLDDRTFLISSREGADVAWMTARLADTTPPGGALGAMLPEIDTTAMVWVAGDDAGAKRATRSMSPDEELAGLWGSLRATPSKIRLEMTFRYPDARKAAAAERQLGAEIAELSGAGIGTIEVARDPEHPERVRFVVDLPRMIVGIVMQSIRSGEFTP